MSTPTVTVLDPRTESSISHLLSPLGRLEDRQDAATLLECYSEAVQSGILWRNIRTVHRGQDGFFYFGVDEAYKGDLDIFRLVSSSLSWNGAPQELNPVTALSILGQGRGTPSSGVAPEVDESSINTGFLDEEESGFSGDYTITLTREDTGERFAISQTSILGRDAVCDLVIVDPQRNISRKHCRLELTEGVYTLEDLGSSNGTYINGSRLMSHKRIELKQNDVISLANVSMQVS